MSRLLIVEDDISDWLPISIFFKSKGWEVDKAEYANEAITFLKKDITYDAMIVDIGLRGETGQRSQDKEGGLKVIKTANRMIQVILVYSGRIEPGDKIWNKLNKAIPQDWIFQKPVPPSQLYEKIIKIL